MARFVESEVKSEDAQTDSKPRGRLLILCGTYSIGKENICLGIARALDCKIWAPPRKQKICAALEDPELTSRLTTDPHEAQIHMQSLMEIRAETLQDYLNDLKPHFSRIVGFRPSGWNYRPPNSRLVDSPTVAAVLTGENWRSKYTMADLQPQRGSTREAACFGVPYSEHSSFRELTMFCCALRIEKVVPTVNVGSAASRAKMKMWIDRWLTERRKKGVIRFGDGKDMVKW
jgi:DNA cross-link repair 1A protein